MSTILDINTFTRYICDADSTSYADSDLLITTNLAYERVVGWILDSDGRWQFDDTNYTTFPRGFQDLVDGQFDYSFNESLLRIEEVHVLDSDGKPQKLRPRDKSDLSIPWTEFYDTNGMPEVYDKDGDSIILGPAPTSGDTTLSGGLRVHFRRTAQIFTSSEVTTGTKSPGFASPWHLILSYMAAIPYCTKFKQTVVSAYELKIREMKKELEAHYGRRDEDEPAQITMRGVNSR